MSMVPSKYIVISTCKLKIHCIALPLASLININCVKSTPTQLMAHHVTTPKGNNDCPLGGTKSVFFSERCHSIPG